MPKTKSSVFFFILVLFIGGIAFRSFFPVSIQAIWTFFILGIVLICAFSLVRKWKREFFIGTLLILAFTFGMFRQFQKSNVTKKIRSDIIGHTVIFRGVVEDDPVVAGNRQSIIVKIPEAKNIKLLIRIRPFPKFSYGDEIAGSGILMLPENFSDDFDYVAYLAKDDIYYVMQFPELRMVRSGQGNKLYEFLFRLKHTFAGAINKTLPEPESSFMAGLLLGERRSIPQNIVDAFATTGTTHIIALSGYNITIVGSAAMRTFLLIGIPFSFAVFFSSFGIVLFALLTGGAASVVRASLMGLLILFAEREGRVYRMRNALTFAGAMMVFQNPAILRFDISFQLSFFATIGLLYVAPVFDFFYDRVKVLCKRFFQKNKEAYYWQKDAVSKKSILRSIFIATLAAQYFSLPLLMYYFKKISLISPIVNILVLPFIPLTMFAGFMGGVFALFSGLLGEWVGWIGWALAHFELSLILWFSKLPYAMITFSYVSSATLFIVYVLLCAWLIKQRRKYVVTDS